MRGEATYESVVKLIHSCDSPIVIYLPLEEPLAFERHATTEKYIVPTPVDTVPVTGSLVLKNAEQMSSARVGREIVDAAAYELPGGKRLVRSLPGNARGIIDGSAGMTARLVEAR